MLKKWMLAMGMLSVLTLAACGNGDEEEPTEDEQMEDPASGDTEEDNGTEDTEEDSEG